MDLLYSEHDTKCPISRVFVVRSEPALATLWVWAEEERHLRLLPLVPSVLSLLWVEGSDAGASGGL